MAGVSVISKRKENVDIDGSFKGLDKLTSRTYLFVCDIIEKQADFRLS